MNTAQLECFVSLANTLNYVRTADQLGLTQPAVSKQIKSLENELNTRLFDRTTRSVSLTQVGQQFLPEASDMLNTYYHSKEWISNFNVHSKHSLRIGYSDPHCTNVVQQILTELLPEYPNLTPDYSYDQTDANLSRLVNGQLDLILGMKDSRFNNDNIVFRKLHEDNFVCILSKNHPLAKSLLENGNDITEIHSEALWDYRQIISIPPYLMKDYFSRGHRIIPVNDNLDNCICVNTSESYSLVLSGFGYSLVPEHLIIEHPDLLFLKWAESPHAPFGIYYRKDASYDKSSALVRFTNIAKEQFKAVQLR